MRIAETADGRVSVREATEEEAHAILNPPPSQDTAADAGEALKEMASAMAAATTLAKMREAAREFLETTGSKTETAGI